MPKYNNYRILTQIKKVSSIGGDLNGALLHLLMPKPKSPINRLKMSEIKLTTREKLDIAAQTGLNAIPYIGGALSALYFGTKQERRFKRIESLYELIRVEFEKIKDEIKPLDDFDRFKLSALIEDINENTENDATGEKTTYFKNCFFNILTNPDDEAFGKRKYFINSLGEITQIEIEILSNLFKAGEGHAYVPKTKPEDGLDINQLNGALERLRSLGFLNSFFNGTLRPGVNWSTISRYSISDFGKEFVEFCLETKVDKI